MRDLTRLTRRDFLKSTAVTAAAALAHGRVAARAADGGAMNVSRRIFEHWQCHRGGLGGAWDVWRTDGGNQMVWQNVPIPHCVNARDAVDPDEDYYQGPCWYRTKLEIENPFPNGRTLLHFEGAGQKSDIFVYLEKVGEHIGGYDEFVVDITDAAAKGLKDSASSAGGGGGVPLAVRCDNSRDPEMIPSSLGDFCRYGGLYRHVNLVYAPAVSLERVHVDTAVQPGGPAKVSVRARLYNPAGVNQEMEVLVRVFDPAGSVIYTLPQKLAPWEGERTLAAFDVKAPELWSPSKPVLYRCEVTLKGEPGAVVVGERFGFRHFEFVTHGPFQLNGERLLLKGTHRHEDHAGLGNAMPDDLIRQEMQLIKDMGANFIRLAHYQQSRAVLDLCDELGLLVWEEIPWCRGGVGGERYKQQARDMLRAMIDQHYNHPSVIVWGLGNENDQLGDFPDQDPEKVRAFMKELNDEAHSLDPGRKTGARRCDFCKDIPDVYSPTNYSGWYRGRYTDYKATSQEEMEKVNHFFHMEWGADSHARRHSEDVDGMLAKVVAGENDPARSREELLAGGPGNASETGDWSETYACNLFDWHLKEQETMPWLTGAAQWIFKDFATPSRRGNPIPYVNEKGVAERDLTLKEGYYVFQSYWTEKPMIRVYGHSWRVRWGEANEKKLVKVYSNCEAAELFLNGVSCGEKKRNSQDFPAAGLHWLVGFQAGENHLRAVGRRNGATVADEVRFQYQTKKWGKRAKWELKGIVRGRGEGSGDGNWRTITVEARLLDANGVACLDARDRVRFDLAGDGTLLDNAGTPTGSRSVELCNGRAEISLLTNGGKSVVSVHCNGVSTVFLDV